MPLSSLRPPITTVLFDWDDTLLDSYQARIGAVQAAFDAQGISAPKAVDFVRDMQGSELGRAFERLQAQRGSGVDLLAIYRRYYWQHDSSSIRLFPRVRDLLDHLHTSNLRMGLVTQKARDFQIDGRRAGAALETQQMGVQHMLGVIVGSDDVTNPKPDPEPMQQAMDRLGARPQETLVVGDTAADMLSAQAAGCWSCHATWGTSPEHEHLAGVTPHLRASSPTDLLSLTSGVLLFDPEAGSPI